VQGNDAYKNKKFEEALELYQGAIDLDDTDMTYYNNKAAVYYEMKEFDKCIEECDRSI
jgi:stress-induced-phosphoprotein 1